MTDLRHGACGPPGERAWAPGRRTGPVLSRTCVGVGEPEPPDRTGSAAVPESSGGESLGSQARYDDHRPERNLDEIASRPGDGRADVPRSSSALVTSRHQSPIGVTPSCVIVTKVTA